MLDLARSLFDYEFCEQDGGVVSYYNCVTKVGIGPYFPGTDFKSIDINENVSKIYFNSIQEREDSEEFYIKTTAYELGYKVGKRLAEYEEDY